MWIVGNSYLIAFSLGERQIGKRRPLSRGILLRHLPMPLAASRVPDKICTERTIGIFEDKIDLIAYTLAIPQRFRKTPAEYVNPMHNIAFAQVVITDHGHRFVLRLGSLGIWRSPLVNFQELVIENPFGLYGVRSGLTHQLPVHRPMANHFIK